MAPVPALRLIFHLADGATNVFPQIREIGPGGEIGPGSVLGEGPRAVSPGVWEIGGIPAGRYNVLVHGGNPGVGQVETVDVVNDGQEVNSSGKELSRVKLSLQVAGQKAVPRGVQVFLRSDRGMIQGWRAIDETGESQPLEIAPGRYEVMVGGTEKTYSIARMSASGCEVSGHTVNLSSGEAAISLTVVEGATRVEGVVKQGDKPVAGAMIVLVPKDPAGNRSLFRRDQSDLDGTFVLNAVFPGTYTVIAIQDGWDLDWSEPEVISAYRKRGQSVEVGDHETRPVTLSQPLEAQPR